MHVFVYGTLLPGYRNHERFAAPHLISSAPAHTAGVLYDLPAGYPGVIEGEGTVHGQVLELPDSVLPILDDLEAFDPAGDPAENEYYRCEVLVTLADGSTPLAWIYFMTPERVQAMQGIRIDSGVWRGPI